MKLIAVLVDKVPGSCLACKFYNGGFCDIVAWLCAARNGRADFCPLMTEERYEAGQSKEIEVEE